MTGGLLSPVPGVHLQLALDRTLLADNEHLVVRLADRLSRVEVGTPLMLGEGLRAVRRVRSLVGPEVVVVADTKICDAGARIASAAYGAGADVVTVVGAATDEQTWQGVLGAAVEARDSGSRAPTVLVDAIGWERPAAVLRRWCASAERSAVPVEVCVHRPKTDAAPFSTLIEEVRVPADGVVYAVAGRMSDQSVPAAVAAGFSVVIVGGAVADSDDPAGEWTNLLAALARHDQSSDPEDRTGGTPR